MEELVALVQESLTRLQARDNLLALLRLDAFTAARRMVDDAMALRSRLTDEYIQPGEWRGMFDPELLAVDFATLRLTEWAEEWRAAGLAEQYLCWKGTPREQASHQAIHTLLVTMANSMAAARLLVLKGLFVQARTLTRAFAETSDLAIAILHDARTLAAYLASHEEFEDVYTTWRSALAPGHLRAVNEKLWDEIGMPGYMREYLADAAKRDQRWLSLAAHSYRVALVLGTMAYDVTRPTRDDSDTEIGLSLEAGAATLRKLADLSCHFLRIFLFVLYHRHGWTGRPEGASQKWSYAREEVLRDIWLEHLCGEDDENEGDVP